ncbi:MAG: tetratricopeptide repeat protein [Thermoleophilia bacterium]
MDVTSPAPAPRPRYRRLAVILGVWLAAVAVALLVASALDDPVGAGDRDAAQPAAPGEVSDQAGGLSEDLPPLTTILDRPLPAGVADLPPIRQAARLRQLAEGSGEARRFVELGTVLQTLGDPAGAAASYRRALRLGGDDVAAETGLAMVSATAGAEGPQRAADRLGALAASHPDSQLVAFNQGWLAVYRSRRDDAREHWERVIAIDADARLGLAARALIASLEQGASGRNP